MVPKVPMALEKVRITAESMAGSTRGRVILRRISGLAGALDLAHLLQLGVDGVQCCGHQQICICVIVERQHDDDRDRAVSQPVGNVRCPIDVIMEAGRAADAGGLEHGQPSLRLTPGGDHIGDDHCQREERLEGKIACGPSAMPGWSQAAMAHNGNADADRSGS